VLLLSLSTSTAACSADKLSAADAELLVRRAFGEGTEMAVRWTTPGLPVALLSLTAGALFAIFPYFHPISSSDFVLRGGETGGEYPPVLTGDPGPPVPRMTRCVLLLHPGAAAI